MIKPLRVVYAGTPEFALPALKALFDSPHQVIAVYTQPDRPAGRGRRLQSSPVKQLAVKCGIPVYQPVTLRKPEAQNVLRELAPDLMVVAAYGLILPANVLALPRAGCINIHASLLPRWRGAAPIQRAILAGDRETGITLMQMEAGLDTGPILLKSRLPMLPTRSAQQLHDVLADLGASVLMEGITALQAGRLLPVPQDAHAATYAEKLRKDEAWMDWRLAAEQLVRQVQAFNPWPVAQTLASRKGEAFVLRIWDAVALSESTQQTPGTVLHAGRDGIDIAAGQGIFRALELQWPGGKSLSVAEFIKATDLVGQCLKTPPL